MGITVSTTGNGKFSPTGDQSDVIVSYSMSESASPVGLSDSSGEIPALSIVGESNKIETYGTTHPSSRLLIDNQLTLVDDLRGSFTGRVGNLSVDSNSVSANVFSKFEKLNATKRISPARGTLAQVFQAYFTEAGITSYDISASLNEYIVVPAWTDNIWNGLKKLCIASNTEIYFMSGTVYVKRRATKQINVTDITSENFEISLGEQSKTIKLTNIKTSWVEGAIAFAYGYNDSPESVEGDEVKEFSVTSRVSLVSVNQPEYVTTSPDSYVEYISDRAVGTVPTELLNGFYSFRDKNGRIVESSQLRGAKITAEITDDPYEIKLILTGPKGPLNAPYTLEFRDNYPALALTGTGTLTDQFSATFPTGSSLGDSENEYTDNPFLVNNAYFYNTAYYTAQQVAGPVVKFSFSTDKIEEASNQEFGFLPGAIFTYSGSNYRVRSVSYDYGSINVSADQYVTFADFETNWTGKTFAEFNSVMLDPTSYPDEYMKHSDFAIIPLMGP